MGGGGERGRSSRMAVRLFPFRLPWLPSPLFLLAKHEKTRASQYSPSFDLISLRPPSEPSLPLLRLLPSLPSSLVLFSPQLPSKRPINDLSARKLLRLSSEIVPISAVPCRGPLRACTGRDSGARRLGAALAVSRGERLGLREVDVGGGGAEGDDGRGGEGAELLLLATVRGNLEEIGGSRGGSGGGGNGGGSLRGGDDRGYCWQGGSDDGSSSLGLGRLKLRWSMVVKSRFLPVRVVLHPSPFCSNDRRPPQIHVLVLCRIISHHPFAHQQPRRRASLQFSFPELLLHHGPEVRVRKLRRRSNEAHGLRCASEKLVDAIRRCWCSYQDGIRRVNVRGESEVEREDVARIVREGLRIRRRVAEAAEGGRYSEIRSKLVGGGGRVGQGDGRMERIRSEEGMAEERLNSVGDGVVEGGVFSDEKIGKMAGKGVEGSRCGWHDDGGREEVGTVVGRGVRGEEQSEVETVCPRRRRRSQPGSEEMVAKEPSRSDHLLERCVELHQDRLHPIQDADFRREIDGFWKLKSLWRISEKSGVSSLTSDRSTDVGRVRTYLRTASSNPTASPPASRSQRSLHTLPPYAPRLRRP